MPPFAQNDPPKCPSCATGIVLPPVAAQPPPEPEMQEICSCHICTGPAFVPTDDDDLAQLKINDFDADDDLKKRLEDQIKQCPTNPLRVNHTKNCEGKIRLVWNALPSPSNPGALVTVKHVEQLLRAYSKEENNSQKRIIGSDAFEPLGVGRFLNINVWHKESKVDGSLLNYWKSTGSEPFESIEFRWKWGSNITRVFPVTDYTVPIYPHQYDTVDAWNNSQHMLTTRLDLARQQREIAARVFPVDVEDSEGEN